MHPHTAPVVSHFMKRAPPSSPKLRTAYLWAWLANAAVTGDVNNGPLTASRVWTPYPENNDTADEPESTRVCSTHARGSYNHFHRHRAHRCYHTPSRSEHAYGDWTHWLLASVSSPPLGSSLPITPVWWL